MKGHEPATLLSMHVLTHRSRALVLAAFVMVPALAAADDIRSISVPANDLVWDPRTQRIYVSVPATAGPGLGNTITAIDPNTLLTGPSVFVGSEPNRLALSDDGRFLYVGLDGSAAVRRFNLQTQAAEIQFPLGVSRSEFTGPFFAAAIAVQPGHANTIAVALRIGSGTSGGVAVFDDGVPRPVQASGCTCRSIAFSADPSRLYGYNNEHSGFEFYRLSVDPTGVQQVDSTRGLIEGFYGDIVFDAGRVYGPGGRVIDPEGRTLLGTFPVSPFSFIYQIRPDSVTGRTFGLDNSGTITAFDHSTFVTVGSVRVSGVSSFPNPGHLIRWGTDGLAFAATGKVHLIRTSLVPAVPALTLTMNAIAFRAGDTMIARPALGPGRNLSAVDIYAVLRTPGGTFYSLSSAGGVVPGLTPIASRVVQGPVEFSPTQYRFTGEEPAGTYTWLTAMTAAGTLTVVGIVGEQSFTVGP